MNKDRLRLIEMQDVASVARDNMGNYRRVKKWGYVDRVAMIACIGLLGVLFAVWLL